MNTCTPAIGDETIANPSYVPATEGHTVTTDNPDYLPATPEVTELTGIMKWNWTGGPIEYTPAAPGGTDNWGWHQVGITNDSKGDALDVVHAGNGKASFFYYEGIYTTTPAQAEQGTPTIDLWVEGTPALGEPFIANPDFIPAHCTTHPVLECPAGKVPGWLDENGNPQGCVDNNPTPLEPKPEQPTPEQPAQVIPEQPDIVTPAAIETATTQPVAQHDELALTGSGDMLGVGLGAVVLLAAGVALMKRAARRA